jgi:pimeloyl-ACP methyl ester carboxylesterase
VRRIVAFGAAGALAASSFLVIPSVHAASVDRHDRSQVQWTRCDDPFLRELGAKCATLDVPMAYARPELGTVTLALSRLRHTAPAKDYKGIMLANPGGPGASGLALAPILAVFAMPEDIRAAYDWIGFDPRGVGSSTPRLSCDPDYFVGPRPDYDIGLTPSAESEWVARSQGYAADCAAAGGELLNHLRTTDNVRDMNLIRAALGAPKLNFYGFSYGTYLAQVYATKFPRRVGRMVLDANVNPTRVWYDANIDQDYAFEIVIDKFFAWVADHDEVYGLGSTAAEVEAAYYEVRAKLTANPIGPLGPSELTDALLPAGYVQVLWPDEAQALSDLVVRNDATALTDFYLSFDGPGDDNGYAMYLATVCTDARWKSYPAFRAENVMVDAQAPFFAWGNFWFNAPCVYWAGRSHHPVNVDGNAAPPLLLIGETLDAATPLPGSFEVRRLFPQSALIEVDGGTTHANSLSGNPCVDDPIFTYLRTGVVPARVAGDGPDVVCPAPPLPEPAPAPATTSSASGGGSQLHGLSPMWSRQLSAGFSRR